MISGKIKVEQVNSNGEIVLDYDQRLTTKEIDVCMENNYNNIKKIEGKYYEYSHNDKNYLIRCFNVTYLGKPHEKYKKRIQIPKEVKEFYKYAVDNNYIPLLMGLYHYKDVLLFVNFKIDSYITRAANNSSAHVYSSDLQMAVSEKSIYEDEKDEEDNIETGYFSKVDLNGNKITVFSSDAIEYFFDNINNTELEDELEKVVKAVVNEKKVIIGNEKKLPDEFAEKFDKNKLIIHGRKVLPNKTRNILLNYFVGVNKNWKGIDCYKEMLEDNYRNKNQSEWPGYYLEYSFEKYIHDNGYEKIISYAQDKVDGGVDLDLKLYELDTYGDLKAHTITQKDIPGNKTETLNEVLEDKGRVIYIICEHETIKDKDCGYTVTKYWNRNKTNRKNDQNPYSYSTRMKNNVTLKSVRILEINNENVQYLKGFKQGKNSNGKKRKVKIMIPGEDIGKFLKMEYSF